MSKSAFSSAVGPLFEAFVAERRALGYQYNKEAYWLRVLDRHLDAVGHTEVSLPRSVVEAWTARRAHESPRTHRQRIGITRRIALFLQQRDIEAHIPRRQGSSLFRQQFIPRIFTRAEMASILAASDRLAPHARCPNRHLVIPELFRILYGCGLRRGEALRLTIADVDLGDGILTINQGKFRKDRLVPLAPSLLSRLRVFASRMGGRAETSPFFPAPHGGPYHPHTPYYIFRRLLRSVGIPHGGRGRGPRLHDLRHTFAVHRLEDWYRAGADLGVKLPLLSAYLGHEGMAGTQRYLRLTANLFPDLGAQMERAIGAFIPRVEEA